MDIKLFNLNKGKIIKEDVFEKKMFKEKIASLLNITIIKEDYYIDQANNDYMEILAIDSMNRMLVIEFRYDKFGPIIKNGLNHIDYIKNHLSEFKMLVNDVCDSSKVLFDPYLMVFSPFFSKDDYNAICHIPYDIELYTLNIYKNECVINKAYVSRKMNVNKFNVSLNKDNEMLCKKLIDYILSLSEEVTLYAYNNEMIFKRMFDFCMLEFIDDNINIYVKKKDKYLKVKENNLDKLYSLIEQAFDCN